MFIILPLGSCDESSCTRDWSHNPAKPLYLILASGSSISNGDVQLSMQTSGNLVLSCRDEVMWETSTTGKSVRNGLHIEENGEMVLYEGLLSV